MFVCAQRNRGREIRDREIDQVQEEKKEGGNCRERETGRKKEKEMCRTCIKLDKRTGFPYNKRWIIWGGKKIITEEDMEKGGQHPA